VKIPRALTILLWPLSRLYARFIAWREARYANGSLKTKRLKATVVSVGNLTVGGTGKTPMVLWLATKFLSDGKRVAILSRGYRGSNQTSDEIQLLRQRLGDRVKFGIGPNRYQSGSRLETENEIDVFILDDGFQHRQLARDLDIVMLDGSRKLRDEWLLPAGLLREPIAAVRRADLLIVTRKFDRLAMEARDSRGLPLFYAQTRLLGFCRLGSTNEPLYLSEIGAGPLFAFCGIGNPDAFFSDLDRWNIPSVGRTTFPDHHKYSGRDIGRLENQAVMLRATGLVTTEKDAQNIPPSTFRMPVWVAVIDLVFTAERELVAAIDRILDSKRGAAA
jgi:tetraacyldisaccharide 4'-kinase